MCSEASPQIPDFTHEPPYRRLLFALNNRTLIQGAYNEAHERADALRTQLRELETQINQAQLLLEETRVPSWPPLPEPVRPPTLHEAIRLVLAARDNDWTNIGYLTDEIARRRLYRRRDGLPAGPREVSARIRTYRHLFELRGFAVRSRTASSGAPVPDLD